MAEIGNSVIDYLLEVNDNFLGKNIPEDGSSEEFNMADIVKSLSDKFMTGCPGSVKKENKEDVESFLSNKIEEALTKNKISSVFKDSSDAIFAKYGFKLKLNEGITNSLKEITKLSLSVAPKERRSFKTEDHIATQSEKFRKKYPNWIKN